MLRMDRVRDDRGLLADHRGTDRMGREAKDALIASPGQPPIGGAP